MTSLNIEISIIIPTYNRTHLLKRALASVLKQTIQPKEILVINDGDPMGFNSGLSEYTKHIKVYTNQSKGVSSARNTGIELASGNWIVFLDDDDEFKPDYLSHLTNLIKKADNTIGFLWSSIEKKIYHSHLNIYESEKIIFSNNAYSLGFLYANAASIGCGYGLTVKKDALKKIGGFDQRLRVCEDTDLILRLLASGYQPIASEPIGVIVHEHTENKLTKGIDTYTNSNDLLNVIKNNLTFINKYPELASGFIGWAAEIHFQAGKNRRALHLLSLMGKGNPMSFWVWRQTVIIIYRVLLRRKLTK